MDLEKNGIAHGDIHYENIILKGEDLILIDYDDIFIKSHIELKSYVIGNPNFRHPNRKSSDNGIKMDNFSFWFLTCSIYILIADFSSWDFYNGDDAILFKENDLKNPKDSKIFNHLKKSNNQEIHYWLAIIFNDLLNKEPLKIPSLNTKNITKKLQIYRDKNSSIYKKKSRSFYNPTIKKKNSLNKSDLPKKSLVINQKIKPEEPKEPEEDFAEMCIKLFFMFSCFLLPVLSL